MMILSQKQICNKNHFDRDISEFELNLSHVCASKKRSTYQIVVANLPVKTKINFRPHIINAPYVYEWLSTGEKIYFRHDNTNNKIGTNNFTKHYLYPEHVVDSHCFTKYHRRYESAVPSPHIRDPRPDRRTPDAVDYAAPSSMPHQKISVRTVWGMFGAKALAVNMRICRNVGAANTI